MFERVTNENGGRPGHACACTCEGCEAMRTALTNDRLAYKAWQRAAWRGGSCGTCEYADTTRFNSISGQGDLVRCLRMPPSWAGSSYGIHQDTGRPASNAAMFPLVFASSVCGEFTQARTEPKP